MSYAWRYFWAARSCSDQALMILSYGSAWLTRRESPDAIRIGLHLVPGISAETGRRLLAERERQPFAGITDLRRRFGLGASQLDTLPLCGALDALCSGLNRDQVVWIATGVGLDRPPRVEEDDDGVVQHIFPATPISDPTPPAITPRPPRALAWEVFRILGVLPAGHPIYFCDRRNDRLRCRDLSTAMAKARVRLVVWPITRKQVEAHPKPKSGQSAGPPEPMAFVTLEDETGLVETVWFPQAYRTYGPLLVREGPLRLLGVVEVNHGAVAVTVQSAEAVQATP